VCALPGYAYIAATNSSTGTCACVCMCVHVCVGCMYIHLTQYVYALLLGVLPYIRMFSCVLRMVKELASTRADIRVHASDTDKCELRNEHVYACFCIFLCNDASSPFLMCARSSSRCWWITLMQRLCWAQSPTCERHPCGSATRECL